MTHRALSSVLAPDCEACTGLCCSHSDRRWRCDSTSTVWLQFASIRYRSESLAQSHRRGFAGDKNTWKVNLFFTCSKCNVAKQAAVSSCKNTSTATFHKTWDRYRPSGGCFGSVGVAAGSPQHGTPAGCMAHIGAGNDCLQASQLTTWQCDFHFILCLIRMIKSGGRNG